MNVEEYLRKPLNERQSHLELADSCLIRGGSNTQHRGVLAQFLNTNIFGRPADLCHACSNGECSNPKHLYWGTRKENVQDDMNSGNWKSPFDRMVEKYGYEEACQMNGRGNKAAGGKANKGKPKTEEHKQKISNALKKI